jgi:hypothetical protein
MSARVTTPLKLAIVAAVAAVALTSTAARAQSEVPPEVPVLIVTVAALDVAFLVNDVRDVVRDERSSRLYGLAELAVTAVQIPIAWSWTQHERGQHYDSVGPAVLTSALIGLAAHGLYVAIRGPQRAPPPVILF